MLKQRAKIIAVGVLALDLVCVAAAFLASFAVRDRLLPALGWAATGLDLLWLYLPLLAATLPLAAILFWLLGFYQSHRFETLPRELLTLVKACAGLVAALTVVIEFLRLDQMILDEGRFSRLWLGLFALFAFSFLTIEKLALRSAARGLRTRGYNYRSVLIVGVGRPAQRVLRAIEDHRFWGYRVVGFLSDEPSPRAPLGRHPVLGPPDDLLRIVEELPVDEVIFALDQFETRRLRPLLAGLEELGVGARIAWSPFPEKAGAGLQVGELAGLPLITYSTVPASELGLVVKRLIDISVALVLLVVALPLLALIAAAIRIDTPGPVLYRQIRLGLNGRRFTILKFRTMVEGAEGRRGELEHLNEAGGPMFKVRRDPRITAVGRLLRRLSLDELPQLWNVLRGDMSLVGPRPILPSEFVSFERWQRRRLSMRPGLTCLWQVEGRSQVAFEDWVRLDLAYIDNWSPLLDMKILLKTIPAVLSGRGAW